jgi:hypothetical protein
MKRLKPKDLPEVLTPEIIDILARMADEVVFPRKSGSPAPLVLR